MAYNTEALLRETLWSWLESQGHEVHGEVTLSGPHEQQGRIDLLVETTAGEKWGIELKNRWQLIEWEDYGNRFAPEPEETDDDSIADSALRDLSQQVEGYAKSMQLDRVLIATQNPEPLMRAFETTDVVPAADSFLQTGETVQIVGYAGFIQTPVLPPSAIKRLNGRYPRDRPLCDAQRTPKIIDRGEKLWDRPLTPTNIGAGREPEVAHHVWDSYPVAIREGVLPNPDSNRVQLIDVIGFTKLPYTQRIYNDGPEEAGHIVGVEAKSSVTSKTTEQLRRYAESGGLTQLYLAVPAEEKRRASDLLNSADNAARHAGLLLVSDDGGIEEARHPTQLELEVGGLRIKEDDSRVSMLGWGRTWTLPGTPSIPVFNQGTKQVESS